MTSQVAINSGEEMKLLQLTLIISITSGCGSSSGSGYSSDSSTAETSDTSADTSSADTSADTTSSGDSSNQSGGTYLCGEDAEQGAACSVDAETDGYCIPTDGTALECLPSCAGLDGGNEDLCYEDEYCQAIEYVGSGLLSDLTDNGSEDGSPGAPRPFDKAICSLMRSAALTGIASYFSVGCDSGVCRRLALIHVSLMEYLVRPHRNTL